MVLVDGYDSDQTRVALRAPPAPPRASPEVGGGALIPGALGVCLGCPYQAASAFAGAPSRLRDGPRHGAPGPWRGYVK